MEPNTLTDQERLFCDLYVDGSVTYAGNASKCYEEVFKVDKKLAGHHAKLLLARTEIQEYIEELQEMSYEETKHMKNFCTVTLRGIAEECSTAIYKDKRGRDASPAPLRSVAVAATKGLMEIYPVKATQQNKSNEGSEGAGITFNVIMPGAPTSEPVKEDSLN